MGENLYCEVLLLKRCISSRVCGTERCTYDAAEQRLKSNWRPMEDLDAATTAFPPKPGEIHIQYSHSQRQRRRQQQQHTVNWGTKYIQPTTYKSLVLYPERCNNAASLSPVFFHIEFFHLWKTLEEDATHTHQYIRTNPHAEWLRWR